MVSVVAIKQWASLNERISPEIVYVYKIYNVYKLYCIS